jgi:hypothetical protein
LVLILVGLALGVLEGHVLGSMVGLIVGIGTIAVAFMFKDEA